MWPRVTDQRLLVALLGGLVVAAWLALWTWGHSAHGRFLSHEELGETAASDPYVVLIAFFVAGWTLMAVAMMLPTSLPLVALFHSFVRQKSNQVWLTALVIAGYLAVWMAFGGVVYLGDTAIHTIVEQSVWLEANAWGISAAIFIVAGAYQFTPLKYHCLDKCRSPMSFIMQHWRGGGEGAQALRLGVHHGLFCLGCCWSLMLLMFAVGVGNIGWMLALAAVMALEKNVSWGRALAAPLGTLLIAIGITIVLYNVAPR